MNNLDRRRARTVVLLTSILLTAVPARSQFWRTYGPAPTTPGMTGNDVARATDGSFVVAYWEGLFKTDAMGALLWSNRYDTPGTLELDRVAVAADGTIGAVGYLSAGPLTFIRVAPDGTLLTARKFGRGSQASGDIVATADGGFVIAASGDLIKVDAAGDIEWALSLGRRYQSLVAFPDGRIAASDIGWDSLGRLGVEVTIFDAAGNPSWRMTHFVDGVPAGNTCRMALLSDGDLAIVAQSYDAIGQQRIRMERVRPDVGVIWAKLLSCPMSGQPRGAAVLADDTIVFGVIGAWPDSVPLGGDQGEGLIGLAPDGAIRWQRVLAGVYWIGSLVDGPARGGVVVTGSFQDSRSPGQAFLGQLDADGWVTSPCAAVYDVSGRVTALPTCSDIIPVGAPTLLSYPQTDLPITTVPRGIEVTCAAWACPALSCIGISLDPESAPGAAVLRLAHQGGSGAVQVAWDIDGDTVDDLTGNPAVANLPAGLHSVTARATDSCAAPAAQVATLTADVDVQLVAPTDPCFPQLLRCGLLTSRSFAGYRGLLTAGGHPVLDPTRDLLVDDLSGLTEVEVALDATFVGDGTPGVIVFYEATTGSGLLRVDRRGSSVVLSGW